MSLLSQLQLRSVVVFLIAFSAIGGVEANTNAADGVLGHFLNDLNITDLSRTIELHPRLQQMNFSATHLRLIPFSFPKPMKYHFDGLAAVIKFRFDGKALQVSAMPYDSGAYKHWDECLYLGSGTGPTLGVLPCLENPVVNLLPIHGQLWLTIDTAFWGQIDPETLATVPKAKPNVSTLILNAHPACDRASDICYVQHPCPKNLSPISDQVCFSKLVSTSGNIQAEELGRATLPKAKLLQHSHSPCISNNFVVSKLDNFYKVNDNDTSDRGLLRQVHQEENDAWIVMDRRTNETVLKTSNFSFVNNHFWNCFEDGLGNIVVDSVPATSEYLTTYFEDRLSQPTNWEKILYSPMRCLVPTSLTSNDVTCSQLLVGDDTLFDYPTFNPKFKMNADYNYVYAISPSTLGSQWFDKIIKVDVQSRKVVAYWTSPGIFVTEASFIPVGTSNDEEDGVLVSLAYNTTAARSSLLVFDPTTLGLIDSYSLGDNIVPFHAHGVSCTPTDGCYANP
eukprot:m.173432 g.173432  ORF g.173432 m.173432 type:complete len:507 (+) comp31726_c0_seq10:48-1568(+)